MSIDDASSTTVSYSARDGLEAATVPLTIGKYRVLKSLGEGGQAEVFRVMHPVLVQERVLKLAHRQLGRDPVFRDALLAEGHLLAELDHPNLVRILDLDFDEDRPFLVLEYVPGCNLQQRVEAGLPSFRQAARWVAELAGVVAYLHQRSIVHLDIKPKNILLDRTGRPRLIDFGLARLRDAWSDDRGDSSGLTLAFGAPEQARGESDRIGPSADIFGLGGVLYYLLTRQAPFHGRDSEDLWARARRGDVDAQVLRAAGVPRPLERIVLKALAPEPDRRYRTAVEFERALRGWLQTSRIAAGLTATAVVVIAGVFFVRSRPAWTPQTSPPPGSPILVTPKVPEPLRVEAFAVEHYRGKLAQLQGTIGVLSHAAQIEDNIKVRYRLSEPVYCYLIALNPDGSVVLCPKDQEDMEPEPTSEVIYPAKADYYFGLTDGTGLQAFVLFASRTPLPAFTAWPARPELPWKPASAAESVWRFDGRELARLGDPRRGTERRVPSAAPATLAAVCDYLSHCPGADAVHAIAFPVSATGTGKTATR
jgi:serine/threonine protein kinase